MRAPDCFWCLIFECSNSWWSFTTLNSYGLLKWQGQKFALIEEKVIISNVFRNFQITSLDQRDKVIAVSELVLQPTNPLRLQFRNWMWIFPQSGTEKTLNSSCRVGLLMGLWCSTKMVDYKKITEVTKKLFWK